MNIAQILSRRYLLRDVFRHDYLECFRKTTKKLTFIEGARWQNKMIGKPCLKNKFYIYWSSFQHVNTHSYNHAL
jgi:hypothetical protein